jgi:hypothetical protein
VLITAARCLRSGVLLDLRRGLGAVVFRLVASGKSKSQRDQGKDGLSYLGSPFAVPGADTNVCIWRATVKESVGSATVTGMLRLIAQLQALGLSGDAMAAQKILIYTMEMRSYTES